MTLNTILLDDSIDILGLDLSLSLIPSWDVVALIVRELPALQCLALKLASNLFALHINCSTHRLMTVATAFNPVRT